LLTSFINQDRKVCWRSRNIKITLRYDLIFFTDQDETG
jgi:hypothetical protein